MSSEDRGHQVATERLRSEFSVVALRNHKAFEFAREALAEYGVILTITDADKLLRENREIKEQALFTLIPRVQRGLPEQVMNDAMKRLDSEWEMLSRQLWCAWKFGGQMISHGVHDISFEVALDLILHSNGDKNAAVDMYINSMLNSVGTEPHSSPDSPRQHQERAKRARKQGYDGVRLSSNLQDIQLPLQNINTEVVIEGTTLQDNVDQSPSYVPNEDVIHEHAPVPEDVIHGHH